MGLLQPARWKRILRSIVSRTAPRNVAPTKRPATNRTYSSGYYRPALRAVTKSSSPAFMTRSLKLIAAAVATLGFAAATPAQEAQLYGLMDLSAGRFQSAGTSKVW